RLPRFFYEVDSWQTALTTQLTPHFGLWELMDVDLHEASDLRMFPRYVPCAVTSLAAALEVFRLEVGATVRIAANGGYRSPVHRGGTSYRLPKGAAVYFDTGVIEIATPAIELERGCVMRAARSLWEGIRFARGELDRWGREHDRRVRLQGFSTHYNVSVGDQI